LISIGSGRECCGLIATPIRHEANASEAEYHHGPSGWFGDCSQYQIVDGKVVAGCGEASVNDAERKGLIGSEERIHGIEHARVQL
jgi:hypothetical protein